MKSRTRWLAIFLVLGLILAACSPSDSTDTTEGSTDATEAPDTTESMTDTTESMTDTTQASGELMTDVGVDVENKVIKLGYLSDLSGPFAALVGAINVGVEFYWTGVNAAGGIDGWTVEMVVRDTGYTVDNHVQFYEELKAETVAIAQSTGSPHTVADRASACGRRDSGRTTDVVFGLDRRDTQRQPGAPRHAVLRRVAQHPRLHPGQQRREHRCNHLDSW